MMCARIKAVSTVFDFKLSMIPGKRNLSGVVLMMKEIGALMLKFARALINAC
jgi:hypothetical protein